MASGGGYPLHMVQDDRERVLAAYYPAPAYAGAG
jgi:hypothetical protein